MSNQQNDIYLEEKRVEFELILDGHRWEQVNGFYKEMEQDGMGEFVPALSEMMSDEQVREYKKWDEFTNGTMEVQML